MRQSQDYALAEVLKHARDEGMKVSQAEAEKHFGGPVRLTSEKFDKSTSTFEFEWDAA